MFTYIKGSLAVFILRINGAENVILSKVQNSYGVVSSPFSVLSLMCHISNSRNQVKLQAYQLEYAWQK
jgi:hypothetical protein